VSNERRGDECRASGIDHVFNTLVSRRLIAAVRAFFPSRNSCRGGATIQSNSANGGRHHRPRQSRRAHCCCSANAASGFDDAMASSALKMDFVCHRCFFLRKAAQWEQDPS